MIKRRTVLAAAAGAGLVRPARAAAPVKVGLILPMTGPFASTGREIDAACRLYVQQNPAPALEIVLRDDAGVADTTRRLAQELIVNDKVAVIAGFGLTPLALAAAPLATRAKVPMVVMAAATSAITEASAFVVRTSQTIPQVALPLAQWAAGNGIGKVVTVVTDYGRGWTPRNGSRSRSSGRAGRCRRACGCRWPIRTSRRSCNGRATRRRTRCLSSSRRAWVRRS